MTMNFPYCSLWSLPLLFYCTLLSQPPPPSHLPIRQLRTTIRCPKAYFLQTKQNQFFQLLLICHLLHSHNHFGYLLDSRISVSILYCKAKNWIWYSRCGLKCWTEGMIAPLHQLTILLLIQNIIQLAFFPTRAHCWSMFAFVSTRTPRSLPGKLLCSQSTPAWVERFFPFHLQYFMRFLSSHFSSRWRSLSFPLAYQLLPTTRYLQTYWKCTPSYHPRDEYRHWTNTDPSMAHKEQHC